MLPSITKPLPLGKKITYSDTVMAVAPGVTTILFGRVTSLTVGGLYCACSDREVVCGLIDDDLVWDCRDGQKHPLHTKQ